MHTRALDTFARRLSGYVCEPGTPDYLGTLGIDNGRVRLPPALVVRPRSAADIALTISFARDSALPMTVKGGGHSAAGYCLNRGGIVLDLSLMKAMTLDREQRLLHVQMGATWEDVYGFLAADGTGLVPVGGGCLTVGLAGFLLGGGYSFLSRSYGLGSDNVVDIDLVTADGRHRHLAADAADDLDRDLFWACRGGGGGNFGVATAMTLRLHKPPTPKLLGGQISYPIANAPGIIEEYNSWIRDLPDAMAVYGYFGNDPDPARPGEKVPVFRLTPVYNGPYADGIELLQPMLRHETVQAQLFAMTLPDWETAMGTSTLVDDRLAYMRSGVLAEGGLDGRFVSTCLEFMASAPSADSFVVLPQGGGAVAKAGPGEGSYAHRAGQHIFEVKSIWRGQQGMRANVEWAYDFGEQLRPGFTGAYLNYIDPLLTGWQDAYYAGNYQRLLDIKHRADPDRFFHFQQAIGSDFEPRAERPLDLSPLNRTIQ